MQLCSKKKYISITVLAFIIIIIGFLLFRLWWFAPPAKAELILTPISFSDLSAWSNSDTTQSLQAFIKSCQQIVKLKNDDAVATSAIALRISDFLPICQAAQKLPTVNARTARQFFEQWFQPAAIKNRHEVHGLFTGYYLPTLTASLHKHANYTIPIYGRPNDLIMVNLGLFRQDLKGYTVAGKINDGKLYPYTISREQINAGALQHRAPVLVWANNKVDAFFMEIQGSGLIHLDNGKQLLLGYAAKNNLPYTAIGKVLIDQGELKRPQVSMYSIKAWLQQHPAQADTVMNQNASYVFFKMLKQNEPLGSQGVPLTLGYSLAVDNHFIPYGIPLWLETEVPSASTTINQQIPWQRLLIAQDSGGAIRGPVRGDIYWGAGTDAEMMAANMKNQGRYYALLPKTFLQRQQAAE